jgi:hypothetical protein
VCSSATRINVPGARHAALGDHAAPRHAHTSRGPQPRPFLPEIVMRFLIALLLSSQTLAAFAATPPAPPGCPASKTEHHQFDFWIGDWDVRDRAGAMQGHSHIEAIVQGCGIAEHWQGAKGGNGVSYNAWDPASGKWHQFWIGNGGNVLYLEGGIENGRMTMVGSQMQANGKPSLQRIGWTAQPDGSVIQVWDQSTDAGKTWVVAFEGIYRKRPS